MTKPILLIDGDILLYKAILTAEQEVEWEPDLWVMWCDHKDSKATFQEMLFNILQLCPEAADPYLCITDKHNFRKDVYPAYKSNRKNSRKPMGFIDFREWVHASYTTIMKPSLEADDCIGILATKPNADCYIYSGDKDLKQIPGKHLSSGEVVTITKEEGDKLFYTQTLTGDPVDGYPGCPGIGKVKADKLLSDPYAPSEWDIIKAAYEKAGLTEDDALVQARCARILRWDDWDAKKQEVKLWTAI